MSGIFSNKSIRGPDPDEKDIKEYLQLLAFVEEKNKSKYKPPKERKFRELAPVSRALIIITMFATAAAVIADKFVWQTIVFDVATWITIQLLNPTWLHNHRKRLGADAAGINVRELERRYERDYLKKDKYISQRLLAAQYQNQVPDGAGAIIYSVGRRRSELYIQELEDENEKLAERIDDLEVKLDDAILVSKNATERERLAREQEGIAWEKAREFEMQKKIAEEQRDRAIREFELEMIGEAITDQERQRQQEEKNKRMLENINKDLMMAVGGTEKETIEAFTREYSVNKIEQTGTITEAQRREILYKLKNGYKQKELAEMYGISQGTVSKIKRSGKGE